MGMNYEYILYNAVRRVFKTEETIQQPSRGNSQASNASQTLSLASLVLHSGWIMNEVVKVAEMEAVKVPIGCLPLTKAYLPTSTAECVTSGHYWAPIQPVIW